jgi:2-methylisocitrate lyase-like PEP mutase family enzyme
MAAQTLQALIASETPLVAPSVYDGISAKVGRELGFKAYYVGSYASGATRYGCPDIGYLGVEDIADQVRRIADIVEAPIIADGEGGFGNPLHAAAAVRRLESAGASAVHIEDHEFGKHLTPRPRVLPLDKALDKIKAALDARRSADLMIIARSDCAGPLGDDEAIARAIAFQEAGADAIFLSGFAMRNEGPWETLRREIRVPVFNTNIPGRSARAHAYLGINVLIYYALTHYAALGALREALGVLAKTGSTESIENDIPSFREFDDFLGVPAACEAARKSNLID